MSTNQPNEIWNEFLKNWPIDKVKSMSLEQYTKSGDKTTFTYWVEVGTRDFTAVATRASRSLGHQHPFRRIDKPHGTAVDIFLLTAKK